MATLGEIAGDALNKMKESLNGVDQEALPELEDGKAVAPGKAKRKYTKRSPKWADGGVGAAVKPKAPVESIQVKFTALPEKRVKINLANVAGEEMIQGAARMPILAADIVGTIATKGRFQLIDKVSARGLAECDRTFKEGVLGGLEIECSPLQAWLITCGMVVGSAVVTAGMQYAFLLKEKAGLVPPGSAETMRNAIEHAQRHGPVGLGGDGHGIGGNGADFQASAPESEGMGALS